MDDIPESLMEVTSKPSTDHKISTNVLQANIDLDVESLQDPLQTGFC